MFRCQWPRTYHGGGGRVITAVVIASLQGSSDESDKNRHHEHAKGRAGNRGAVSVGMQRLSAVLQVTVVATEVATTEENRNITSRCEPFMTWATIVIL